MKLLFISLGTLTVVAVLYATLRLWGLAQPQPVYDHPWLQPQGFQWIVKVDSLETADRLLKTYPHIVFWLNVRMSQDEKLFVHDAGIIESFLSPQKLSPDKYKGDKPYFYSYNDLLIYFPEIRELQSFLKQAPHQRFIINIQDNAYNIHEVLSRQLKDFEKQILIQSEIDVVLKSLKELRPRWLYGLSTPELVKMNTLNSVGLGMTPSLRADVWISPLTIKKRSVFDSSLQTEIKRRNKKIFLGPVFQSTDLESARTFKIDGLIFGSADLFLDAVQRSSYPQFL